VSRRHGARRLRRHRRVRPRSPLARRAPRGLHREGPRGARVFAACSLVFLDPPYGEDLAVPALTALAQAGWLADNALAVVEIAAKEDLAIPARFAPLDERRYGAAKFVFLRYAAR